jgi:2-polyprenyl-3-methyl-5-hydroxy-6-metoxy-1,4-benzoquinol methylase
MSANNEFLRQWHDDEERWWNQYGEYMTFQWKLTSEMSESVRGEMERDYKSFLLRPGESLLDLGCGSGWLSVYFAERGMNVIGIDVSREQISAADELKAHLLLNNVSFQCADFVKWDAANHHAAFENVFVSAFLHHLPESELQLIMKQIAFVLKPGGRAYLYEPLQRQGVRRVSIKIIDRLYNTALQILLDKLPRWFNWWSDRHLAEIERGYKMCSPHEAPVAIDLLEKCCGDDFDIVETKGWHLNSLGFAMQSMGLIDAVRKRYAPLVSLWYRFDQMLFRQLGWEAFSQPGRFILCSVKLVRR